MPVSAAVAQRSMWLDCVALWIVRWLSSGSISITEPRVSIGWFDWRWHDNRSVTTRSAAANTASTSPNVSVWSYTTLLPAFSHSAAARAGTLRRSRRSVERGVVDLDEFERILGEMARGGDHERHGVADVADLLGAERRKHRRVQAGQHHQRRERMGEPLDVGTGVHGGHAGCPPRRRDVDRRDPGVGERAAQERRVQDPRRVEVGDVADRPVSSRSSSTRVTL